MRNSRADTAGLHYARTVRHETIPNIPEAFDGEEILRRAIRYRI